VETGFQADYLRERLCDNAQGFFLHRPMGGAELEVLITAQLPASVMVA
jgi:EAL domain-containing protein (putative c-di-GMP-specific phosphodiesterase class I)